MAWDVERTDEFGACVNNAPIGILYAFDPRRVAILLIGGDKSNDPPFYDRMILVADDLYEQHRHHLESEHD